MERNKLSLFSETRFYPVSSSNPVEPSSNAYELEVVAQPGSEEDEALLRKIISATQLKDDQWTRSHQVTDRAYKQLIFTSTTNSPYYEWQEHRLFSEELTLLKTSKEKKAALWTALQKGFNL